MAPHSSTLAWKIPWMEEPGRLWSMGSLRVGPDWATSLSLFSFMHWRRKGQPTPVFLPGESQRRGSLVGWRPWGRTWMKWLSLAYKVWKSLPFWWMGVGKLCANCFFILDFSILLHIALNDCSNCVGNVLLLLLILKISRIHLLYQKTLMVLAEQFNLQMSEFLIQDYPVENIRNQADRGGRTDIIINVCQF